MQELPEMHAGSESGGAKGTLFEFFYSSFSIHP